MPQRRRRFPRGTRLRRLMALQDAVGDVAADVPRRLGWDFPRVERVEVPAVGSRSTPPRVGAPEPPGGRTRQPEHRRCGESRRLRRPPAERLPRVYASASRRSSCAPTGRERPRAVRCRPREGSYSPPWCWRRARSRARRSRARPVSGRGRRWSVDVVGGLGEVIPSASSYSPAAFRSGS